jgi:N-acetylglucosamine-6-sulfatase
MTKRMKDKTVTLLTAVGLALVSLVLGVGMPTHDGESQPARPNILIVMTDDVRKSDYGRVAQLQWVMSPGLYFHNAFVTTALCCSSRSTALTGMYVHNHGITHQLDPGTGEDKYHAKGLDRRDLPNWLRKAGYDTVLIGKYLNRYVEPDLPRPGWTEWYGAYTPSEEFKLNENGKVRHYQQTRRSAAGYKHWEYVLGDKATNYIRRHAKTDKPWFMWYATHAAHSPELVAGRHRGRFANAPLPKQPNFDEADVSDKPKWVRNNSRLTGSEVKTMTAKHRARLGSLLAVADNLGRIKTALRETRQLGNTYIIFTSDNGYHLGEHRLRSGKNTAYEEDIRVPLVVRGPEVPNGTRSHMTTNTDLAPTVAALAGVTPPYVPDGRSFVPLLAPNASGITPDAWRKRFMAEHYRGSSVSTVTPTNKAVRGRDFVYNRHTNGEGEYYNLAKDPSELISRYSSMRPAHKANLNRLWNALATCKGVECRKAEN